MNTNVLHVDFPRTRPQQSPALDRTYRRAEGLDFGCTLDPLDQIACENLAGAAKAWAIVRNFLIVIALAFMCFAMTVVVRVVA